MSTPSRVILLLLAILSLTVMPALAKPQIAFEKTEVEFTDIEEGSQQVAKFNFQNTGDMNLVIDEVNPSCGCTVAQFDKAVKPGEYGVVTLNLDTEGIVGYFRKTATVVTNDPDQPFVTLIMVGETLSAVKVEGGRRIELNGCLGQEVTAQARLTNPKGGVALVAGVENPMKDYCHAWVERDADGKSYLLKVKAISDRPARFAGQLFLRVPGAPKVSVWVVGDIKGAFGIRPEILFFGAVTEAKLKGAARSIELTRACVDKLEEPILTYDKEKFNLVKYWEKPGEKLLLVITPNPGKLPKGAFQDTITISSGKFVFKVPMRGTIY